MYPMSSQPRRFPFAAPVPWTVGIAVALLVVDLLAWRVVAAMFDRERLVIGRSQ